MRSLLRIRIGFISLFFLFLAFCQAQNSQIFSQDEVIVTVDDCQGMTLVCLEGIPPAKVTNFAFTLDNNPYPGPFPVCHQDTLGIYSYEFLFGKGNAGPYRLDSWVVNGQTFSGQFLTIADLVDSMQIWDPLGAWTHLPSKFQIRGGQPGIAYSQMNVTVLSISTPGVIGYNVSFSTTALGIPVQTGIHQVVVLDQSTGDLDTLRIIAGCHAQSVERITTEIGMTGSDCPDLNTLLGPVNSLTNECPAIDYPATQAQLDPATGCVSWTGTAIGEDTLCLVACDTFGFCTSTTYIIEVLYPGALNAVPLALYEGDTLVFCPDLSALPGNPVSMVDLCPQGSGLHADVTIPTGAFCVHITGLQYGEPEYACLVVCDDLGNCDSTTLEIRVLFRDTVVVDRTAILYVEEEFCPDISAFSGTVLSMADGCPDHPSLQIDLDPVTMCVTYTGVQTGQDTVCLLIQAEYGNESLTLIRINMQAPTLSLDTIDVVIGQSVAYCPDLHELAGNIVTMIDDCPQSANGAYSLVVDMSLYCMDITGQSVGEGQACIIVCDDNSICDTVLLHINVIEAQLDPVPVAVDDQASLYRNEWKNISVLWNDTWASADIVVAIVSSSGPTLGQVVVESNGSITYTPDPDACGSDQFQYSLCNASGCDTAVVSLEINCSDQVQLEPYSGFSPNGDGINEYFTIKGIESYPRNTLEVYNRWGNRIFKKTDYQGDWDGTWGGLVLPDGTYYYILQAEGLTAVSGYVYLHR